MYDLKKVIEANTNEDTVDYEAIMATIDNDYVNPIVAKKADESKLMPKAINKVIEELGVDGESIDDLKLYVKKLGGSTDEVKEANIKLEREFKDLKKQYDEEVETRSKLEQETTKEKQYNAIKSLGVEDPDNIEYLHYKFNKAVTDEKDFNTIVQEYAKENDVKTTTRFVKDDFGGGNNTVDVAAAWREKRAKQGHRTKD